jgi:hypothetical protein
MIPLAKQAATPVTKPVQNISALRLGRARIMPHRGGDIAAQYAVASAISCRTGKLYDVVDSDETTRAAVISPLDRSGISAKAKRCRTCFYFDDDPAADSSP